jgi:hypothetical protein
MGVAWLNLWRERKTPGRDGVLLAAALVVGYAPWLPNLLFQAAHTGAPWAERPSPLALLGVAGGLFGYLALPLLALAVYSARGRIRDDAVRSLFVILIVAAAVAWLCAQIEPSWSTRYLAVLFGPGLLAIAATVSHGNRWTAVALTGVLAVWVVSGSAPAKSNVRTVAHDVRTELHTGDLVVSTQPEQVPVLDRYLPDGLVYLTPLGVASDPRITDWRDGLTRLRHGYAQTTLEPLVAKLTRGQRILLVTPVIGNSRSQAPWQRAIRTRTREWRQSLRDDPHLRRVGSVSPSLFSSRRNAVRALVYEVR